MFNRNTLLAACAALVLSACGGGGGSDGAPSNEIPNPTTPVEPGKPDPTPEPVPEPEPEPEKIRFNDTGIQFCTDGSSNDTEADCNTAGLPRQDTHQGRDAAAAAGKLEKTGAGGKGFDFTKIANDGTELPATAELGPDAKNWACTRDNVTGLIWEVKVKDAAHLRHFDHTYLWQDDQFPSNSAPLGAIRTDTCQNPNGLGCTTKHYVSSVNAAGLCGATDWRMPSPQELLGIVDMGKTLPPFDSDYFPNMPLGVDYTDQGAPGVYGGRPFLTNMPNLGGKAAYQLNAVGGVSYQTADLASAILLVRDSSTDLTP